MPKYHSAYTRFSQSEFGVFARKILLDRHGTIGQRNWVFWVSFINLSRSCLANEIKIVSAAECVIDNPDALIGVSA